MNLHLGYPTITKGHKLIGVTHVAKPTKAHRNPTCSQTKNYAHRAHTYYILHTMSLKTVRMVVKTV
jgi:hypothetical protein